jgi:hypothetical protein
MAVEIESAYALHCLKLSRDSTAAEPRGAKPMSAIDTVLGNVSDDKRVERAKDAYADTFHNLRQIAKGESPELNKLLDASEQKFDKAASSISDADMALAGIDQMPNGEHERKIHSVLMMRHRLRKLGHRLAPAAVMLKTHGC